MPYPLYSSWVHTINTRLSEHSMINKCNTSNRIKDKTTLSSQMQKKTFDKNVIHFHDQNISQIRKEVSSSNA